MESNKEERSKIFISDIEGFKVNENKMEYKKVEIEIQNKQQKLLIIKDGNEYKVTEAFCPHQGYPMHLGKLIDIEDFGIKFGTAIKCPAHFWTFSLDNGQCDRSPHKLKILETIVENNEIFVLV